MNTKKTLGILKHSEHQEQCALIRWADVYKREYLELEMLFAIPNGGARHIAVAKKLKSEGARAGVPDLMLAVTRLNNEKSSGIDSGLFIEMKVGRNKLSKEQKDWRNRLINNNYVHVICYSWLEAARAIQKYLGLPKEVVPYE